jgi:acetoin utilization deacetylase AcuC-like enzyme
MRIIDNDISYKHKGKNPEVEKRLTEIRKRVVGIQNPRLLDGEKFLHLGHSQSYIEAIKQASKETGKFYGTRFSPETYRVATAGVGASLLGAETESFVLTRPPGHHAGYDLPNKKIGLGDCVFNNMAITAKYLRDRGKRVFVLDIDLHRGNGTQNILGDEENIFVFDVSRKGGWPGYETSSNNCFNLELEKGTKDDTYARALEEKLIPELERFRPDIIGVSAGFDTDKRDVADYLQDAEHPEDIIYFELTKKSVKKVKEIIRRYPHFAILEGGYNKDSVNDGVGAFVNN